MSPSTRTASGLDLQRVAREWPSNADGSIYFNTGSCGVKPRSVVEAVQRGWESLNYNPTLFTFFGESVVDNARSAAATLFSIPFENLLLTQNTVQGLQLILESFLLNPGDELITTDHEHGSFNAQVRYLEETRGIVVRRVSVDPLAGSAALCQAVVNQLTAKTKLVEVSEIDCYSGWKPRLLDLAAELAARNVPFLVDGAHSPGQVPCSAGQYPLWVGSGHKWLGGPNGTGFLYAAPNMVPLLKPSWIADRYYSEEPISPLHRLEYQGTTDVTRWLGLAAALNLQLELGPEKIFARQIELREYFLSRFDQIPGASIQSPDVAGEITALLTLTWEPKFVPVPHLRDHLWDQYKIWLQPDYLYGNSGHGLRLSFHISISESQIDRLVDSLIAVFGRR